MDLVSNPFAGATAAAVGGTTSWSGAIGAPGEVPVGAGVDHQRSHFLTSQPVDPGAGPISAATRLPGHAVEKRRLSRAWQSNPLGARQMCSIELRFQSQ